MEVEMNKYVIQYENGRSVTVTARNLEDGSYEDIETPPTDD